MTAKYRRGDKITDPAEAIIAILNGRVIYWRHKAQNSNWLQNNSIRLVAGAAKMGILYHAIKKEINDE